MMQPISEATTLIELLRDRAQRYPDQPAFIWLQGGETPSPPLNFAQLDRRARAIASHLQSKVKTGDRALLVYPYNAGLEFIMAFLGCLYAGIVAVPSHSPRNRYALQDLTSRLISSGASAILTTAALQTQLRQRMGKTDELSEIVNANERWITLEAIANDGALDWQCPPLTGDTLAFLQYTSGSTGVPKGITITHAGLLHNQKVLSQAFGHTQQSIGVGWLPLFHDMGLIGNAIQPLYLGSLCVLMSPIDFIQKPVRWLRAISQFRATTSGGPNFAYDLLCRQVGEIERQSLDLSSWEVAFLGAEPVRVETMARFSEIFAPCGFRRQAFYPCYGMAEATLFICGGNKDEFPRVVEVDEAVIEKDRVRVNPLTEQSSHHFSVSQPNSKGDQWRSLVSCGHPWLNGRVAIADPNSLTSCGSDQVGEIWVATAGLGRGYWQQPQETERTFYAYLRDTGEGPFLRTGDLGFVRDGEIYITGRLHDVMVFFGLNHYPQHIEETVQHAHPAFRHQNGAAFSVEVNGENRLVIAQEVNRHDRHRITVSEVVEPIRWAIFERYFIDVYSIVLLKPGVLPKTPSGKIQRGTCRTRFLDNSLPVLDEWRSPTNQIVDIPTLVRRYLNPLIHFKRYIALTYTQVNLFFIKFRK